MENDGKEVNPDDLFPNPDAEQDPIEDKGAEQEPEDQKVQDQGEGTHEDVFLEVPDLGENGSTYKTKEDVVESLKSLVSLKDEQKETITQLQKQLLEFNEKLSQYEGVKAYEEGKKIPDASELGDPPDMYEDPEGFAEYHRKLGEIEARKALMEEYGNNYEPPEEAKRSVDMFNSMVTNQFVETMKSQGIEVTEEEIRAVEQSALNSGAGIEVDGYGLAHWKDVESIKYWYNALYSAKVLAKAKAVALSDGSQRAGKSAVDAFKNASSNINGNSQAGGGRPVPKDPTDPNWNDYVAAADKGEPW